jgi:uncharacterized membrane protein
MALLPAGFALPPLPYLLALLLLGGAVAYLFVQRSPAVTDRTVAALTPWMLAGAWLHVLHVVGGAPGVLDPLLGTPSVYVSTAILAGGIWVGADAADLPVPTVLAGSGVLLAGFTLAGSALWALENGSLSVFWPAVAAVIGVGLGLLGWVALQRVEPAVAVASTGGALALVAHSVDAISTAVGIDILGAAERTPLSRYIIELGAALPTADLIGTTWLFVVVKVALASFLVWILADYVREDPRDGRLLLVLVAAVGLGPGAHNLLLFTISG